MIHVPLLSVNLYAAFLRLVLALLLPSAAVFAKLLPLIPRKMRDNTPVLLSLCRISASSHLSKPARQLISDLADHGNFVASLKAQGQKRLPPSVQW